MSERLVDVSGSFTHVSDHTQWLGRRRMPKHTEYEEKAVRAAAHARRTADLEKLTTRMPVGVDRWNRFGTIGTFRPKQSEAGSGR